MFQADWSIKNGHLATLQASSSSHEDLLALTGRSFCPRPPSGGLTSQSFRPSKPTFWRLYTPIFPSKTTFWRLDRSIFLYKTTCRRSFRPILLLVLEPKSTSQNRIRPSRTEIVFPAPNSRPSTSAFVSYRYCPWPWPTLSRYLQDNLYSKCSKLPTEHA